MEHMEGMDSVYYNPEDIDFLLTNWLPLFGLWGSAVLEGTGRHYLTNAKVESWFV